MKGRLHKTLLTLAAMVPRVVFSQAPEMGDVAPDFELKGSDGVVYKLSDYKGKKAVVVAWFPKAFTGGWTAECLSFREIGKQIKAYDAAYFTASCDKEETNKKFAASLKLDYPILSDPTRKTALAYGLVKENAIGFGRFPKRWTFYIGKNGKILAIDKQVKTRKHGTDVLNKLEELKIDKVKQF